MDHRHLLPDEVDLLVDGEEGFGVAPLVAHVERCARCRAEVEAHRQLVTSLERLPHLSPAPLFAHRVMRRVQVFEPWHVAALDWVRRFVPRSRPARVAAAATAGLVATTLTLATLWIATRLDALAFLVGVAAERTRSAVLTTSRGLVSALFGDAAAGSLGAGGVTAVAVAGSLLILTIVVAAFALRAAAAASRRRRT